MSRRTVTLITCDSLALLKVECDAELIGPADDEFELGKLVEREGWTSRTAMRTMWDEEGQCRLLCPKHSHDPIDEIKRKLGGVA